MDNDHRRASRAPDSIRCSDACTGILRTVLVAGLEGTTPGVDHDQAHAMHDLDHTLDVTRLLQRPRGQMQPGSQTLFQPDAMMLLERLDSIPNAADSLQRPITGLAGADRRAKPVE